MRFFLSNSKDPLIHISSGMVQAEKNFILQKRSLDTFVIVICVKGTVFIGQDDYRYTLRENQYVLLFAGHEHFGFKESTVSYFWCHFKVKNDRYNIMKDDELSHLPNHFSQYYIIPEQGNISTDSRAIVLFRQLLDVARNNCYSARQPNYSLSLLAMEISQEFVETHLQKNSRNFNPRMEKVIEWIRINFNLHLTVEKMAKIFLYNPDYLSTAFRKYSGTPLKKYICMIRISNAKKLLINTNATIKEIAFQVGFKDEKAFMKRFKQMEDITPSSYRNAFPRTKLVR